MAKVIQLSVESDERADERRVLLDTRSRPYRGYSMVASVARGAPAERMARVEVFRDGFPARVLRQPAHRIASFEGEFQAMVDEWMTQSPAQPTELEMHRADYQAVKAAGFESPGELLVAYKRLAGTKAGPSGGGGLCKHRKSGRIYQIHYAVRDCTNRRDGTVMVAYSVAGLDRPTFVREASEFAQKFEVSEETLARAAAEMSGMLEERR